MLKDRVSNELLKFEAIDVKEGHFAIHQHSMPRRLRMYKVLFMQARARRCAIIVVSRFAIAGSPALPQLKASTARPV
jgi:hypothetical protein